jgi:hypothetical protein
MRRSSVPVLHGRYIPPAVERGDRIDCLVRDCTMVVTGWTDARISWPRGCRGGRSPGSPSIILDDELARAVQHESAAAISYWWGVTTPTVVKWRRALGVDRRNNAGSQVLIHAATTKARAAVDPVRSPECRRKQRENAIRRRLWELAPRVTRGLEWTPAHQALIGTMPDRDVAARTGHPLRSVRHMRLKLGIAPYRPARARSR